MIIVVALFFYRDHLSEEWSGGIVKVDGGIFINSMNQEQSDETKYIS